MFVAQAAVAAKAGPHGFPTVKRHKAAVRFVASTLHGVAAGVAAARSVRRLFCGRAVVTDGATRFVMASIAGNIAVRCVIEGNRHARRIFSPQDDGVLRIFEIGFEILCFRWRTPGEREEKCEDKERFHAQSPGR